MVVRRSPSAAWRTIAGQGIVLGVDSRTLRGLNPVATRVWELIDGARSSADIVAEITREFAVDAARARRDIDAFLGDLLARRLVEPITSPADPPRA
ncbi:MAG: PqqD family protein [Candidatus Rokubacteria bacterium]|nr:PqqD family protein [Candidatus Rokubacteria bacterium]